MKRTLLTIAVLLLAIGATAQDKTPQKAYRRDGNAFVQTRKATSSTDTATPYVWRDSKGNEYPIFLHTITRGERKGRVTCVVIRTSKKGNQYRDEIPNGEEIAREIMNDKR